MRVNERNGALHNGSNKFACVSGKSGAFHPAISGQPHGAIPQVAGNPRLLCVDGAETPELGSAPAEVSQLPLNGSPTLRGTMQVQRAWVINEGAINEHSPDVALARANCAKAHGSGRVAALLKQPL